MPWLLGVVLFLFMSPPSHPEKEMGEGVTMEDPLSPGGFLAKSPARRILFRSPGKEPSPPGPFVATAASPASSAVSPPGQRGQYNCPIGLYSAQTLREMAGMQGKLGEGAPATDNDLALPG